jgi:hypothetical protein
MLITVMTSSVILLLTTLFFSCATQVEPTGTNLSGIRPPEPILVEEDEVPTLVIAKVHMPAIGMVMGEAGSYGGESVPSVLTSEVSETWQEWFETTLVEETESAGYVSGVGESSPAISGPYMLLRTDVTGIEHDVVRYRNGFQTRAEVNIAWTVISPGASGIVFEKTYRASGRTAGISGDAVRDAFRRATLFLLSDEEFVQSLREAKPSEGATWETPIPPRGTIIRIDNTGYRTTSNLSAFGKNADSVITILREDGHGSGFFITEDGHALTNHHVVAGELRLVARMRDGTERPIRVIRSNANTDTALIQVDVDSSIPVKLSDGDSVEPGTDVLAIGTPLVPDLSYTVTKGIVSAERFTGSATLLQTDASVSPGNSGGPLVEEESGVVVGIVSSKVVREGVEGLGFAVSIGDALSSIGVRIADVE